MALKDFHLMKNLINLIPMLHKQIVDHLKPRLPKCELQTPYVCIL